MFLIGLPLEHKRNFMLELLANILETCKNNLQGLWSGPWVRVLKSSRRKLRAMLIWTQILFWSNLNPLTADAWDLGTPTLFVTNLLEDRWLDIWTAPGFMIYTKSSQPKTPSHVCLWNFIIYFSKPKVNVQFSWLNFLPPHFLIL